MPETRVTGIASPETKPGGQPHILRSRMTTKSAVRAQTTSASGVLGLPQHESSKGGQEQ